MTLAEKKALVRQKLAEAKSLAAKPTLTAEENADLRKRVDEIEGLKAEITAAELSADLEKSGSGKLYDAVKAAGFDRVKNPNVIVPVESILGPVAQAKSNLIATTADALVRRGDGAHDALFDSRWVYPYLVGGSMDYGTTTIQRLIQTTRALASAANMQKALDHTDDFSATDTQATLTDFTPIVIGSISNPQPNVLYASDELAQLLNRDLSKGYARALDDKVIDVMAAATTTTASQGTDTSADFLVKACNDLIDLGANPSLIALPKAIAEPLQLTRDANDRWMFENARLNDVAGVQVVVSTQLGDTTGYVIDRDEVEVVTSPVEFSTDSSLYFASSRTIAKVEGTCCVVIKNATAINELTFA
jgi:hypothetical protein